MIADLELASLLLGALLLQPVLAEDGPLRVVAVGIGGEEVEWTLDGVTVARTRDGEAARIDATAGRHELWATTGARDEWRALARPDREPASGAEAVPAWSAVHPAEPDGGGKAWLWPAGAALGGAGLLVRPRRLLKRVRRRRRR